MEKEEEPEEEDEEVQNLNESVTSLINIRQKKKHARSINPVSKKDRDSYRKKLLQLERKVREEETQNNRSIE